MLKRIASVLIAASLFTPGCKNTPVDQKEVDKSNAPYTADTKKAPPVPQSTVVDPDDNILVDSLPAPEDVLLPAPPVPTNPTSFALGAIFGHRMVIQRDVVTPFWGTGPDGMKITVTVRGKTYETVVANKKWKVDLDAQQAGGPFEVAVRGPDGEIVLKDVMFGDVFMCAGQANMSFGLDRSERGKEEIAEATNPNLRIYWDKFKVAGAADASPWVASSPAVVPDFSAICYLFAKEIQRKQKIPVGLLRISAGGTRIQSWMSRRTLEAINAFDAVTQTDENGGDAKQLERGLRPIASFKIKGVVWYQGESNTGTDSNYQTLLKTMMNEWRSSIFGQPTLPFFIIQLPAYAPEGAKPGERRPDADNWARTRDAQLRITREDENTFLVVTMDQGDQLELNPPRKAIVAQRLVAGAEYLLYNGLGVLQGPILKSATRRDATSAVVEFDHAGEGLEAKGGTLNGFEVCNQAVVCTKVKATISGKTVIVDTIPVTGSKTIRYGFRNFPVPAINLYNKEGYQASPFNTAIVEK